MDTRRPNVGVGVIIMRGNELLLQLRKGAHGSGTWSLPGGHLEWNESFEACAAREVAEETGLEVVTARFVGVTNDRLTDDDKHYLTVFMHADWRGEPVVREPEKVADMRWFPMDCLPEPLFMPLRQLVEGHAYGRAEPAFSEAGTHVPAP